MNKQGIEANGSVDDSLPLGIADHPTLIKLFSMGKIGDLLAAAEARTKALPDDAFAWKALALALQSLKRGEEALKAMQTAIILQPDDWEAQLNFGVLLQACGRATEAELAYRKVLAAEPQSALAHRNLGLMLLRRKSPIEAEASLRAALSQDPLLPEVREGLARTLESLGRFSDAEEVLLPALQADPGNMQIAMAITKLIERQGRLAEAEALYRHITDTQPTLAEAHNNLGVVLQKLGRISEAEKCLRRALNLSPRLAEVLSNLGNVLAQLGRGVEAQSCFRRALALNPDFFIAHSNLLGAMNEDPNLTPGPCLTEARRYGKRVSAAAQTRYTRWHCEPAPARLRVGFVSGDLRSHPVGYFIQGLIEHFDQDRFEFRAYVTNPESDALTERFKTKFTSWHSLDGLSDAEAAARIHADGVHILVDLSGHTADNRLPVFGYKPAPVQMSWLGYFATTGVTEMDWYLADPIGIPEAHKPQFTESIWTLPDTRLCFTPPDDAPKVSFLPMQRAGKPCFGSFHNLSKLNDRVLRLWARVMAACPDASLRIQARQLGNPDQRDGFLSRLSECGIDRARVSLHGPAVRQTYLEKYAQVDLVLDTFPYCGGTTTCEALWMGVPTLTLIGETQIARQGASLMQAAGLPDWVVTSEDAFVEKARSVIHDPAHLAQLRAGMRDHLMLTPLFNTRAFTDQMQRAFHEMWLKRAHQ